MKFKKLSAFLFALCVMLSLSISAFAAEKAPKAYLSWDLRSDGTLYISGNGKVNVFKSADDQPWAALREDITSVQFDPGAHMIVPDVAYWFAGCSNLRICVLPSFTNIGTDAFQGCAKLARLQLYYHDENFQISDSAFSGVNMDALEVITCDDAAAAVLNAYGLPFISAYPARASAKGCGITDCTCTSCTYNYEYEEKDSSTHYVWEVCSNCSANEYAYRHTESHAFSNGICTKCGYSSGASCSHSSTRKVWSGCNWEEICNNCGATIDWGTTHGSYTYGAWEYYTTDQHRRYGTCDDCGKGGKYQYASHSTVPLYTPSSDTQHELTQHCSVCDSDVGGALLQPHSFSFGEWINELGVQHKRSKDCADCGYSGYDYASHSYTYSAWSDADETQHKRSRICAVCEASDEEYADHLDADGDGTCDDCGHAMAAMLTWDYGDGTFTTSQPYNTNLLLPDAPVKDDFTFDGWFTDKAGGTEVTKETVFTSDMPMTYYAHWSEIEIFSVTVPFSLPLVVDENGGVHVAAAEIVNGSSGAVAVTSVSVSTKNDWMLVPYATNMAHEKVDARLLGFKINDTETTKIGSSEMFQLSAPWKISENSRMSIHYDAVVSAVSQPVTEQDVLSVVFVLEWLPA